MDESKEFNDHHLPHLLRYVVPILWNPMEAGSGVLLRIQDRHFVASAAHCIQSNPLIQIMPTSLNLHAPVETRTLRPIRSGWHAGHDIGWVEITDPGCEAVGWDQMFYSPELFTGQVHVLGYPKSEMTINFQKMEALFGLCTFSTGVMEAMPDYLKLHYPVTGSRYDEASGSWSHCPFPTTPHGFSGGGVFAVAKSLVGGMEVYQYKLVAIQSCWLESERYVKAISINILCDLLKSQAGLF